MSMRRIVLSCFATLLLWTCGAQSSKIALITAAIGDEYAELMKGCVESKRIYCEKQGYDFICGRENLDRSRPLAWSKIKLIQKHLQDYDWIFWSDADSYIKNMSIRLEDLIDDEYLMIVAHDWNGMNTGQFLLKNCPEALSLLQGAYDLTHLIYHPWWEQAAIRQYLSDHPALLPSIKQIPQRWINSYPIELAGEDNPDSMYQPGDFVVHFPGARGAFLRALIEKYKN